MVSSKLQIEVMPGDGVLEVAMRGELDADNCAVLAAEVPVRGSEDVVVDMTEVRFVDSSGISEILKLRERVAESGGELRVPAVSPQVRKVLEITGLVGLLKVASA